LGEYLQLLPKKKHTKRGNRAISAKEGKQEVRREVGKRNQR